MNPAPPVTSTRLPFIHDRSTAGVKCLASPRPSRRPAATPPIGGFKCICGELHPMSSIELTSSQKTVLRALVDRYTQEETAVKGEAIAEEVDRNPGTIRNQMQSLKALQLVEGVPGPKGGYKPTVDAYEALEIQQLDTAAEVPRSEERR